MTTSTTFDRIQLIDDAKQFKPNLNNQISTWDLRNAGTDYNLVAVLGSQSSGKSTLLNQLFDTKFEVMDRSKRQQTTKGVWMCRAQDMNVLVMDVEGTDGRERGEDKEFERKSALFSLASSEVLIVNLMENQVGSYQGANVELLKTVFEANLRLFGNKSRQSPDLSGPPQRTLLLFVIRDYTETTPLTSLQETLTTDLQLIWTKLSKAAELQNQNLDDYFDLSFTALSHKIFCKGKFDSDVQMLRARFTDKSRNDFVFKTAYHKRIPADGLAFYMMDTWEKVLTNKDLDLPTQQELLAQFRCNEISAEALAEFNNQAERQKQPIEEGKVINGLGEMMRSWRSGALARYDHEASRYHQGVYKQKRADLVERVDSTLSHLFWGQLNNLRRDVLAHFKVDITGLVENRQNSAEIVKACQKAETCFIGGAQEAIVTDVVPPLQWEEQLRLLQEDIHAVVDKLPKDVTKAETEDRKKDGKKVIVSLGPLGAVGARLSPGGSITGRVGFGRKGRKSVASKFS
ncbi:RHD3/Sey1 [Lactifluus volemus]|nr:RHD3/Sey1 [Lactifluus volemus]